MTIIVEDGTLVAGAESFCTVAFADAYHQTRGNAAWDALDDIDDKEPALRKATDYMEQMYRMRWKGFRISSLQALSWPRADVEVEDGPYRNTVAINIVPKEVKNACAEFALRSLSEDLAPDLTQTVSSETVGPIKVDYEQGSQEGVRYRAIDALLSIYLKGSAGMAKLVRA